MRAEGHYGHLTRHPIADPILPVLRFELDHNHVSCGGIRGHVRTRRIHEGAKLSPEDEITCSEKYPSQSPIFFLRYSTN